MFAETSTGLVNHEIASKYHKLWNHEMWAPPVPSKSMGISVNVSYCFELFVADSFQGVLC